MEIVKVFFLTLHWQESAFELEAVQNRSGVCFVRTVGRQRSFFNFHICTSAIARLHRGSWMSLPIISAARMETDLLDIMGLPDLRRCQNSAFKACALGEKDSVMSYMSANGGVGGKNQFGDTLLHMSSAFGHESLVCELLLCKANSDCQNVDLNTPLIYAVATGNGNIVKALLKASIDTINARNSVPCCLLGRKLTLLCLSKDLARYMSRRCAGTIPLWRCCLLLDATPTS